MNRILKVSDNRRFLVHGDGTPFFYLGDTAWELFHRLNLDEAETYLSARAAQRFTVIQAVVLAEFDGLRAPNANGDVPFFDLDPARPNEAYFRHVDAIVARADELGLWVGMLPTWGDKWNCIWGDGPEIFTPENARVYGEWLGRRYRDAPVIWIAGGDRPLQNEAQKATIRAMAQGLRAGDEGRHLLTFHPNGGESSATWLHDESWLDFNMQQNGHDVNTPVWERIAADYGRTPIKPILDGEPLYEEHPIGFNAAKNGYSKAEDIRKFAYGDVFAGAFGHTYGDHTMWQFHAATRGAGVNGPLSFWPQALGAPGATQMQFLRALIESRPFLSRIPDATSIVSEPEAAADSVQATRDEDGSYALIYSATGQPFSVNSSKLSGERINAHWFDPRTGTASFAGEFAHARNHEWTPPSRGAGHDWVLALDDATRDFPIPGQVKNKL